MVTKKVNLKKEGIKLVTLYKQCLEHSAISDSEEIFITDILATVFICNNIYLSCGQVYIRDIKRIVTDIDASLTSLYFKNKNKGICLKEYKKEIRLKINKLELFLNRVCDEK